MAYALELVSFNTGDTVRIGSSTESYDRAGTIARSVSNDPLWKRLDIVTPSEEEMGGTRLTFSVAGGLVRVVKV